MEDLLSDASTMGADTVPASTSSAQSCANGSAVGVKLQQQLSVGAQSSPPTSPRNEHVKPEDDDEEEPISPVDMRRNKEKASMLAAFTGRSRGHSPRGSSSDGDYSGLPTLMEMIPLFQSMDEQAVKDLLFSAREVCFARGDVIALQGEVSKCFFYLTRGTAVASKATKETIGGKQRAIAKVVKNYGPWQLFGELGVLLKQDRAASIIVTSQHAGCLAIFPRDAPHLFAMSIAVPTPSGFEIRQPGDSMTRGLASFKDVAYNGVKERERQKWCQRAETHARKLARQSGSAADLFTFYMEPMPMTMCLPQERWLRRYLKNYADSEIASHHDQSTSVLQPILSGASDTVLSIIAVAMVSDAKMFSAGEVILSPKQEAGNFCVLFTGEIMVSRSSCPSMPSTIISQPGMCFGDTSFEAVTSPIIVETITEVTLYTLSKSKFETILECNAEFKQQFEATKVARAQARCEQQKFCQSLTKKTSAPSNMLSPYKARRTALARSVSIESSVGAADSVGTVDPMQLRFHLSDEDIAQNREHYLMPGRSSWKPAHGAHVDPVAPVNRSFGHRAHIFNEVCIYSHLGKYESLDFEEDNDFEALHEDQGLDGRESADSKMKHWILSLSIGLCTGIAGFLLSVMVSSLTSWKWESVFAQTNNGHIGSGYLCLLLFTVPMSVIAAIFVYIEPEAAGSGIPCAVDPEQALVVSTAVPIITVS